jgi:hypothetical protein
VAAAAILDQKEAFVAAVEEQRKEYNATVASLASALRDIATAQQDLARQIGRLVDQRELLDEEDDAHDADDRPSSNVSAVEPLARGSLRLTARLHHADASDAGRVSELGDRHGGVVGTG